METEQTEPAGQTLRQYIESRFSFDAYFKSKIGPVNSERQDFYRIAQKPSSINENLISVISASDEKGRDEKQDSISILLWQHLEDRIVGVRKPIQSVG